MRGAAHFQPKWLSLTGEEVLIPAIDSWRPCWRYLDLPRSAKLSPLILFWLLSVEVFICRCNISDDRVPQLFCRKLYMYNTADFVSLRHTRVGAERLQSQTPIVILSVDPAPSVRAQIPANPIRLRISDDLHQERRAGGHFIFRGKPPAQPISLSLSGELYMYNERAPSRGADG